MEEADVLAYVKAAAAMLRIPVDDARAQRVAEHMGRTADMAALLQGVAMDVDAEPAQVYCPAPFPDEAQP
jgi:hypothetical protein